MELQLTERQNHNYYREIEDYDWVAVTKRWTGLETWFTRWREKAQVKAVRIYGGGLTLDAGCGTGLVLQHLPAGSVGVDLNIRHLERARKYAAKATPVLAEMERLPFKNRMFDTVVSGDALGCLVNPTLAIEEFARVMKKCARLILSVSKNGWGWKLRWLSRGPKEPEYRLFSQGEIEEWLEKFDLTILEVMTYALGMELLVVAEKVPAIGWSAFGR